jgi:hypothetical protein
MDAPRVAGLKQGKQIGLGGCGRVFHATDAEGADYAVKFVTPTAVSIPLLEKMTRRLGTGGWPDGVMPMISADFARELPFWIMPLVGESGDGAVTPRSLQMVLDEFPGTESWKVVKGIARALAGMHAHRVAHGNLKPGNVFLTDNGRVVLSDWALGNMPGIRQFQFTDAVLYQSPEQLRRPEGYLEEEGYRWDVFSFGVLAFRLLTGRFPRCHDAFHFVAPASGVTRKDGIQVDLDKLARNLETQPGFTWPDAPGNELEAGFREWIARCLPLDPAQRPASMVEVAEGFAKLEQKAAADGEREALLDQRRRSERRSWRTVFFAGGATAAAVMLGGLWHLSRTQLEQERAKHRAVVGRLESATETAVSDKQTAEKELATASHDLSYERDVAVTRLEASRRVGDRLFAWAMEKGNRRLPPLDGRELRLKQLERYYDDFLTGSADIVELAGERARARLALAEISIAAGDAENSSARLADALAAWKNLPMDGELKFRVATDWLLLALLRQASNDPETQAAFVTARKALENVPQTEVDTDRLNHLLANLDLYEAKLLAANGDNTRALEQLMRATQTLNRIADQRPDIAILRSELAACYLSSATILEGMGSVGDAREVRALASVELVKLLEKRPQDFALRLDLAGCYAAMAESAVLSGDITGAESISKEAMKLLDSLVVEQPDNPQAVSRKASQLGLRAGILRDRGQAADAMKDYDAGIRMLEDLRASSPGDSLVAYRLALLWWQKGRMLGMSGKRDQEIAFIAKAKDLLGQLEAAPSASGPRPDQLQGSGAYLLGDLGHALQLANRKDEAKQAFTEAVVLWKNLVASRPQSEEYTEGLAWCRQRLADLQ